MRFANLTQKNIRYYARFYKLIATAALITVAVIVGSLVVGDSVRTTLLNRVYERLGNTETILFTRNGFLSEKILETPLLNSSARGVLLTNGFVSQSGKLILVFVWGVDNMNIPKGSVRMNRQLVKELGNGPSDAVVLRLPATGMVPSGSLFVTENYTTGMRLSFDGIVEVGEGGNINMKNEQSIPYNVFVDRHELAETLETEGKINLILSSKVITHEDFENAWNYGMSGLSAHPREDGTEILSDRVFLQREVTEVVCRDNREPNRLFSYLANSIENEQRSIPYSFVTAIDSYKGIRLEKRDIILSDYTANRLQAKVGDRIQVSYFKSADLKTLSTDSALLYIRAIVPLDELKAAKLSTEFPGLSDVERCTDWDSDLPIDMELITDEDEKYWELHRDTPKALIAYEAVSNDWSNAYGNATAIRVANQKVDLSALRSDMFGLQLISPKEGGIYAALNGVDFAGLFLALGFFIIVSALLLLIIPLSEMLFQRRHEIALLQSLGYSRRRITGILWRESAPVVLIASLVGVIAGLVYTFIVMWLLGNVWKGATHTDGFAVYPALPTILIGFVVGVGLSLLLLRRAIVRTLKEKKQTKTNKPVLLRRKSAGVLIAGLLTVALIVGNLLLMQSVVLFVIAGILLLTTAALGGDYMICRNGGKPAIGFHADKLVWGTLYFNRKQAILSFFALAIGIFIVFSVGLNRKSFADSSQLRTGTGGYTLWCESSVPVYHNLSTAEGRSRLSLQDLPADTEVLQCLRLSADDASCLNLNKVSTPTVLGVDFQALINSDFQIAQNIEDGDKKEILTQMRTKTDKVYPVMVDATVLTWGLMMSLGDTLWYESDKGEAVGLQLAATLSNSIFQGNILIDKKLFAEIWPETTGSQVFLLKVSEEDKEPVGNLLGQALNEYGVNVMTTNERLKQFNTVTDTYLTIFLTLGGLGLLLGIMSFIIVVRKNLAMRREEIALYSTLGFTKDYIREVLVRENLFVPLYAIAAGVLCSLAGIINGFGNVGVWIWVLTALFTLFFVACVVVFVKREVKREVSQMDTSISKGNNN